MAGEILKRLPGRELKASGIINSRQHVLYRRLIQQIYIQWWKLPLSRGVSPAHTCKEGRCDTSCHPFSVCCVWMRSRLGHLIGVPLQWRAAGTRKREGMREVYKPAQGCCAILMSILKTSKAAKEDLQGFLALPDFLKLFQMQPMPTKIGSLLVFQTRTWRYAAQTQYSPSQAVKIVHSCHVWSDDLLQTTESQIIHLV